MQENTKDIKEKKSKINKEKVETKSRKSGASKKSTKETATTKKASATKNAKTSSTKSSSTTKSSKSSKKVSTTVKKKTTTKSKKPSETVSKKAKVTKKSVTPRTSRKSSVKKTKINTLEYYDLPYRYNQTVVKILAQTPKTLFVYWDISDDDRQKYIKEFGDNFFNDTFPVLIVHNKTMNYSFEIEINDFANSWYFNVNDSKCDYEIELGRRPRNGYVHIPNNYMYVTSSNVIEAPNSRILFEKNQKVLFFRNVKSGQEYSKDINQFNFMQYFGRIYNIYDIYKKIYKNDELRNIEKNPSSTF